MLMLPVNDNLCNNEHFNYCSISHSGFTSINYSSVVETIAVITTFQYLCSSYNHCFVFGSTLGSQTRLKRGCLYRELVYNAISSWSPCILEKV